MINAYQRIRLKELIDDYFTILVLVLVVLAAVGGWATYTTVADPGTKEEEYVRGSWQTVGEFNHSATVQTDTPLLEEGDVYTNETVYFTDGTPVLGGTFGWQFGGAPGDATVTTESTLVNYAYHEGLETRMWELEERLETEEERLEAGEPTTTNFTVNVGEIRTDVEEIGEVHEASIQQADVRTDVVVDVTVDGTVAGDPVQQTYSYRLPINSTEGYYVVHPPEKEDRQYTLRGQRTVTDEPSAIAAVGSLLLLIAPLAALGCLYYGRENDWYDVSAEARAEAEREKLQSEFDDWISTGTVSDDDRMVVAIDSLEGLVDVAIDADRRVVEDTEANTYVVLDDDVRYEFVPDWADSLEDESESEGDTDDGDESDSDDGQADAEVDADAIEADTD